MSAWEDDGHRYGYFTRLIEEEIMTDKQAVRKIVDDYFRCVVCEIPVPMGQKRICEGCAEQERTQVALQAEQELSF